MTSSSVWPELGKASPSDLVSGFAVAPREPFFAPWAAISDVRIVRGRAATRTMVRLATTVQAEASTYPGYFPSVGRPLLLRAIGTSSFWVGARSGSGAERRALLTLTRRGGRQSDCATVR